jgi:hypothetical protein
MIATSKAMHITLCSRCASTYYDVPEEYRIRRADMNQVTKQPCTKCDYPGFDFSVTGVGE